eukprot:TRINITY_DN10576_c0_g1_i1.p1 TRINITY_DN10576_c0_g1~~TRINITY_DN10576_c0_g1_i1.p1  ORF type:complete len:440 (+),score=113.38 TRINITY_DN10576_c0_g1_i1:195-1322(+)
MEDLVDACWLACVMGEFDACRRILKHGRTASKEMMLSNLVRAHEAGTIDLQDEILAKLSAEGDTYPVDPELLFEDRLSEDCISYCISCGFRCTTLTGVEIPATANRKCSLLSKATSHLPLSPYSTAPITEGSPLCEADLHLMRLLTTPTTTPPIYQAAFAIRSEYRTPKDTTWVGHVLYLAAHHANDDFWRSTVMTRAFWEYISDREVPKDELVAVKDGRPVRYPSRLRRVIAEIFPVISEERKERVIEFIVAEHQKQGVVRESSVLVDQVEEAMKMVLEMAAERAQRKEGGPEPSADPFDAAVKKSQNLISPSTASKLQLYAYYKQATEGDCNIPKPGMFEMEKKAKWDAWTGVKGTSTDTAKAKYIELVESLA